MSETTLLPDLPQDTTEQLLALRGTSPEEFYALVKALKTEGWSLRAIASAAEVSRTSVHNWLDKHDESFPLPPVPKMPVPDPPEPVEEIPAKEQAGILRSLAAEASHVRRFTDPTSSAKIAAVRLEEMLIEYSNLGVSRAELARICGVSDSSIKQRLRKYNK